MASDAQQALVNFGCFVSSYAIQNSKCRCWCRLRGSAPFISPLNWTEVGPSFRHFLLGGFVRTTTARPQYWRTPALGAYQPTPTAPTPGLRANCVLLCFH